MAVVEVSSSDAAVGTEANGPLNGGVKASFDVAFGSEGWQLTKGTAWPYAAPYRVLIDAPSYTSVIIDDFDPYDYER